MIETIYREAKQLNKNHPQKTLTLWGIMAVAALFVIAAIQMLIAGEIGMAMVALGLAGAAFWGSATEALRLFQADQEDERTRLLRASEEEI